MKFLLLAICLVISPLSFAQTTTKKSARAAAGSSTASAPESHSDWYQNHVLVGLQFGQSSDLSGTQTSINGHNFGSTDLHTDTPIGLTARYMDTINSKWNWDAGATIYQSSEITGYSAPAPIGHGNFSSKPNFMPVLATAGVEYKVNQVIYLPVGANYAIYNQTNKGDFDSMSMKPEIGYQLGAGARINRNFTAELLYQQVSYNFSASKSQDGLDVNVDGQVQSQGMKLQGLYIF